MKIELIMYISLFLFLFFLFVVARIKPNKARIINNAINNFELLDTSKRMPTLSANDILLISSTPL
jgi:hypothetical protein